MKHSFNRYVIFNLIWIMICLITIIFGNDLPIEFASPTMKSISFVVLCIGLPVSIIWTGNQIFHFKSKAFTIATSIISLPIIMITLFGRTMCATTDEIIYTSRTNTSTIVARSFGCGAWDSDFPKYTYYKKTPVLGIFYVKTTVDTSRLNKLGWIKQ